LDWIGLDWNVGTLEAASTKALLLLLLLLPFMLNVTRSVDLAPAPCTTFFVGSSPKVAALVEIPTKGGQLHAGQCEKMTFLAPSLFLFSVLLLGLLWHSF
jgi:hypothetical protein